MISLFLPGADSYREYQTLAWEKGIVEVSFSFEVSLIRTAGEKKTCLPAGSRQQQRKIKTTAKYKPSQNE
jgi:hypothetical protein